MKTSTSFSQAAPEARLEAVLDPASFVPFEAVGSPCAVRCGEGRLGGKSVGVVAFDRRVAGGTVGSAEAERLIPLFRRARGRREPLLLLMDSGGARLSDGTAAAGIFRRVYREALATRLAGVPMLALVGATCFGGASMLACLCGRRVYSERTLLGMSGPGIIAAVSGGAELDARDRAAVQGLLGGAARALLDESEVLAQDTLAAFRAAALEWMASPDAGPDLRGEHRRLQQRLAGAGLVSAAEDVIADALAGQLRGLFPGGYTAALAGGVLAGSAICEGRDVRLLGIVNGTPLGAQGAWSLAERVLGDAESKPIVVLFDCPGHAATRADESLLLSAYLVHLSAVLARARERRGSLRVWVTGEVSGGVYLALACPAGEVRLFPGGAVRALPREAVATILPGAEEEEALSAEQLIALGAVDAVQA